MPRKWTLSLSELTHFPWMFWNYGEVAGTWCIGNLGNALSPNSRHLRSTWESFLENISIDRGMDGEKRRNAEHRLERVTTTN